MTREEIFGKINQERERQKAKWGDDQSESWGVPVPERNATWYVIAAEELGEVAEEVLNVRFGDDSNSNLITELVQTAAVLVAWLEKLEEEK